MNTLRIKIGRFLIKLGSFIQSLSLVVMRPDDLVQFNRESYDHSAAIASWGDDALLDQGLTPGETDLLAHLPIQQGRLLLLGLGGGRDAIALGKMGFAVVGVDFVPEMVARAEENAARHGVTIQGIVQEISRLEMPPASFDLGLISAAMYSSIPTRRLRVATLQRIKAALKPKGYFLCQFILDPETKVDWRLAWARKAVGLLSWGNRWHEPGDTLRGTEFTHIFLSEDELKSEFGAAGFDVVYFQSPQFGAWRAAVLQRPA
jgi:SAM-dependent methyltransferase